jgi:hypothetical protein
MHFANKTSVGRLAWLVGSHWHRCEPVDLAHCLSVVRANTGLWPNVENTELFQ